jgi:hypothetical protein
MERDRLGRLIQKRNKIFGRYLRFILENTCRHTFLQITADNERTGEMEFVPRNGKEAALITSMDDRYIDLLIARRLFLATEISRAKGTGEKPPEDLEKEYDALASDAPSSAAASVGASPSAGEKCDTLQIRLRDLIQKLRDLKEHPAAAAAASEKTEVTLTQTDISIRLRILAHVEGLVVNGRHSAETDRYLFEFIDGGTFRITDKWTGKSTTIWGDPHVDTSDQEGSSNGEFSDLKESDSQTSLLLQDGTRITFTAKDRGVIERVDIFHGNQHASGTGYGSPDWSEDTGLFRPQTDNDAGAVASALPMGDVVHAGGDGADWFDSKGNLVWGKTTGPSVDIRPAAVLDVEYQRQIVKASVNRAV